MLEKSIADARCDATHTRVMRGSAGSSTASMHASELSTGPSRQEIQQSLERNLVARETTRFYEEYFKTQQ